MAIVGFRVSCTVILTIIAIYVSGLVLIRGVVFLIAGQHQFLYWEMTFGGLAAFILFIYLLVKLLRPELFAGGDGTGPLDKSLSPSDRRKMKTLGEEA